ncbi:glycerol kinase GlpK [Microbulbifer hydrolyticus]|uniref:Glycerol kinase n=1 Tax=Microbulbifer hydrolyticus TaxID=48074 RepID=A0A6P1TCW4_9GAMM|nr:glycerol kinase GlpK [Microbulbifer hydrolyticus]MBB5213189.1 glycerol kinase [Microbulbifer hydrolyticus]QHQ38542.1 glycerol kinase GlpK [Microbulbifer hydrolyticus]
MILSIDQGTTGTTAFVFDADGQLRGRSYSEFPQYYPRPGWVEHDAEEIWQVTLRVCAAALQRSGVDARELTALGITNQRETTILWDRHTGEPVHRAIVWQCRRSAEICSELREAGAESMVRAKTGLLLDAYFSASKLRWIFQHSPDLYRRAVAGELCFGTVDSWLIWRLTGGRSHLTDHTNASRTLLYDLDRRQWDSELLKLFGCPPSILPEIRPSAGMFATTDPAAFLGAEVPITGVAGDQQAALYGQGCVEPGSLKNTYGTGCFMLACAGNTRPLVPEGLLTTIACDLAGQPQFAIEGSVFNGGAAVQWLRDDLGVIQQAAETEQIALGIPDTRGVYLVPAFSGLGAPHWDAGARGAIFGLTRGAGRAEIVRATLESIAYQSHELAQLMAQALGVDLKCLRVDGGASANNFLMQFQADISRLRVERPRQIETTAVGAALLAGIGAGVWPHDDLPKTLVDVERDFLPQMGELPRRELLKGWACAVAACRTYRGG